MNAPDTSSPPVAAGLPLPLKKRPRRRRRWLIVLGGLALLALVPVAGYLYLSWQAERDLQQVLAEMEADDPRWRFEQMMADRPMPADADNPAVRVAKVEALLRGAGGFDVGEKNWPLFDDLKSAHGLNEQQLAVLHVALDKHPEAIQLARTLREFRGEGNFGIKYSDDYLSSNLEPLQRCRNVMNLLQHDAMRRSEEGDAAGAAQCCQSLLVTARSLGREPSLIGALIRYAGQAITVNALERTLAQGEPPDAELAAMQALLAAEIEVPLLHDAMRGERGGFDQMIAGFGSGKLKASMLVMGGSNSWETWFLDHVPLAVTGGRADYLRLMNEAVQAAKLPPEQQREAFRKVDDEAKRSQSITVRLLMPAVTKVSEAHRRSQANLRCALVAVAAERYRLKHSRWPATLDDLVTAGLLKAVPTDPYDGQPLRFRPRPDGAVVYSVGNDRVDNGGVIDRNRNLEPGTDQGFELWDAGARRQPPLPPKLAPDDGAMPGGPP